MKATWSGTVTFGLVSIPVNVYTATEDSGPALNFVHEADGGRVSTKYACKDCGELLEWGQMSKGHEIGRNEDKSPIMVCLTADELAGLDSAKSRQAEVIEFVDAAEISTDQYGQLYYLAPQPPRRKTRSSALPAPNTKGYSILRETMRRSGLVALVTITLRNREQRAMLHRGRQHHRHAHAVVVRPEVRPHEFYDWEGGSWPEEQLSHDELDMAAQLVECMRGKYDASTHVDPYAVALTGLIEGKRPVVAAEPVSSNVVSIVDRLHAAVASAS